MKHINRIIVAVDLSEHSEKVIDYAIDTAQLANAELVIINVINQRDVDIIERVEKEYSNLSSKKYIDVQKEERSKMIDNIVKAAGSIMVKKIIKVGNPYLELLQAIKNEEADLIIMGTKGRGNLSGTLFGSVAEKMFKYSPIPLLSVRN